MTLFAVGYILIITMPLSDRSNQTRFLLLVEKLKDSAQFCTTIGTLHRDRKTILSDMIWTEAIKVDYPIASVKTGKTLQQFQSQLGRVATATSSTQHLHYLFESHARNTSREQRRRQHIAARMGFNRTPLVSSIGSESFTESSLRIIPLIRQSVGSEYPSPKHFVLKRNGELLLSPPQLKDTSCNYCTDFEMLDETQLQYFLSQNESAVFIDAQTNEIVSIVPGFWVVFIGSKTAILWDFDQAHESILPSCPF